MYRCLGIFFAEKSPKSQAMFKCCDYFILDSYQTAIKIYKIKIVILLSKSYYAIIALKTAPGQ